MRLRFCTLLVFATLAPALRAAEPRPWLEAAPAHSMAVFGIRDQARLKERGDEFLRQADAQQFGRFSEAMGELLRFSGLKEVTPQEGPLMLVVAAGDAMDESTGGGDLVQISVIYPMPARKWLTEHLTDDPDGLREGKLVRLEGGPARVDPLHAGVRDGWLYVGKHGAGVKAAMKSAPLSGELTEEQRTHYRRADCLMSIHPPHLSQQIRGLWPFVRGALFPDLNARLEAQGEFGKDLLDSLGKLRILLGSFELEQELRMRFSLIFARDPAVARTLERVKPGPRRPGLHGFPAGPLLLAQSGPLRLELTSLLAETVGMPFLSQRDATSRLLDRGDLEAYLGTLREALDDATGLSVAIYENAEPRAHGVASGLIRVDTPDPAAMVERFRTLAQFTMLEGGKDLPDGMAAEITRLVQQLGDNRFRVRESATRRLQLIGLPAVRDLDRLSESGDPDLARRAMEVREAIQRQYELRQREARKPDAERRLRPMLGLIRERPQIEGVPCTQLVIRPARVDVRFTGEMTQYFGLGWDRLRVVPVEGAVLIAFGSVESQLPEMVRNLKAGRPGLAADPAVVAAEKQFLQGRTLQTHGSVERLRELFRGGPARDPKCGVSGLALSAAGECLELNLVMPAREFGQSLKP